ncbi:hypothetical protein C0Q70_09953 [Pomacea canaliculata]|uniref:TGF-beta propeptide domain-containing protein n=1 Tax=Pomacea canaliculata TaxID=400727 RepID=A0A2T7PB92_POMCA|nr:hypothetical protein C0Q70_09953 [Pomacea canaliculata]
MSPAWLSLTLVLVLVPSLTFSYPSDYSELQMRERDGELSAPSQKDNKLFLRALLDHLVLASRQRTLQSPDYQASAIRDFNDPSYISDTFNNDGVWQHKIPWPNRERHCSCEITSHPEKRETDTQHEGLATSSEDT